ncbi:hypothetical protein C7H19_07705 [Aphanothece hegewaldii CCALA 016]|uniref:Leucine rich repeat variant n=1 Tax=Aphanothece hegewaldii CCALA 016 TaxID=2107694 RepID=A0A2T1LZL1_9CHRO|nr:hypothetical protein [Aphanothece hegewaldii]PSF37859.1 hypothetical protein C7H19_07705 [Aphanothece hegewaldii CCALA 016]
MPNAKPGRSITPKQEAVSEKTSVTRLKELAQTSSDLAKLVAKNVNADPDLLRELGSHSDTTVRKNVASNPNTPFDVLLKLAGQFPRQLLSNPVFDLLLLENPNFLSELSDSALRSLLKREDVPDLFLQWTANHQNITVRSAVVMNPKTPKTVLETIYQECIRRGASKQIHPSCHAIYYDCLRQWQLADLAESVQLHVNWAGEMPSGWHEAARRAMPTTWLEQNRETAMNIWKIGALPVFLLPTLYSDLTLKIAEDETLPQEALRWLIEGKDREVGKRQLMVVNHPNTSSDVLIPLMGDHFDVGYHFPNIQNLNIPFQIQQQFLIEHGTVEHPRTSEAELRRLSSSQWKYIRLGVAAHLNTPVDVLTQLAEDKDETIRFAVALNVNTSTPTLEKLQTDADSYVHAGAYLNIKNRSGKAFLDEQAFLQGKVFFNRIYNDLGGYVDYGVTRHSIPQTMRRSFHCLKKSIAADDPELLTQLADSPNKSVQWEVALNQATPIGTLVGLILNSALNDDQGIQDRAIQTLIQKSDTSEEILQELSVGGNWRIKVLIVYHPNVSLTTLEQLAQSQDWQVRLTIARHPNLPSSSLAILAEDGDKRIRQAVGQHHNTEIAVLEKLVNDLQGNVRNAAIANLTRLPDIENDFTKQYMIVSRKEASITELEKLSRSEWRQIRVETARHPRTPVNILEKLATDQHLDVRTAVARNLNTPVILLERLLQDKEVAVRLAAVENINMPINLLEELANGKKRLLNTAAIKQILNREVEGSFKYLEPYAKSSTPSLGRLAVFLHSQAPVALLAKNIRSLSWLERYAIAQNPNTPPVSLKILANDGNRIVRATAKAKLTEISNTIFEK